MSLRRNALVAASFAYLQAVLAFSANLFVTRMLLRVLGTDLYGLWLATGGLLAYAALADLGVFGAMPWLIAEADGEKNLAQKRNLIGHGLLAGGIAAGAYVVVAGSLWFLLPALVHLNESDQAVLSGPIQLIIGVTALGYPLRFFSALRAGLQDFKFVGAWNLIGTLLNAALTYTLLRCGFGLYAAAIASVVPPVLVDVACLVRTARREPELLHDLERPRLGRLRPILASGAGSWLWALGWKLALGADAILLAYLGYRHLVASFTITSRLGLTLMHLSWALPDSGSIGLAHLSGAGSRSRTTEVVRALLRLHLLPAGAIACALLASNAAFVHVWVGSELYAGARLNALLGLGIVAISVAHGLAVPPLILGSRLRVGAASLVHGLAHIALGLVLGHWFGLLGIAAATVTSSLLTTAPIGMRLLSLHTDITPRNVIRTLLWPWAVRLLPCATLALFIGWAAQYLPWTQTGTVGPLLFGGAAAATTVAIYLWATRAMLRELPLGPRLERVLGRVGLR